MLFPNLVAAVSAFLSLLLQASLVSANINIYNWSEHPFHLCNSKLTIVQVLIRCVRLPNNKQ